MYFNDILRFIQYCNIKYRHKSDCICNILFLARIEKIYPSRLSQKHAFYNVINLFYSTIKQFFSLLYYKKIAIIVKEK